MIRHQLSLAGAITLALASSSFGHDLSAPAVGSTAVWRPERLAYMPEDRASALSIPANVRGALLYIVALPNRWSQGRALRVCFVGGSASLRSRILQVAQTWIGHTNLSLST